MAARSPYLFEERYVMGQEHGTHPSGPAVLIRSAGGTRLELTLAEYRLALLCLVDFDGEWEGLEAATGFVPDASAKVALIRGRLRPHASQLSAITSRGVDAIEMLAARFWFRQEELK
jgi:hypothetical protein